MLQFGALIYGLIAVLSFIFALGQGTLDIWAVQVFGGAVATALLIFGFSHNQSLAFKDEGRWHYKRDLEKKIALCYALEEFPGAIKDAEYFYSKAAWHNVKLDENRIDGLMYKFLASSDMPLYRAEAKQVYIN